MELEIGDYENIKVNNGAPFSTVRTAIFDEHQTPGSTKSRNMGTGRVDHFMKKSTKAIVSAYIRQYVQKEYKTGFDYRGQPVKEGTELLVEIELGRGFMPREVDKIIDVPIKIISFD